MRWEKFEEAADHVTRHLTGSGRLMLKNGMMYIGTFDQDLFHGKGALRLVQA